MKAEDRRWFVGAYAATASLSSFPDDEAQEFYAELSEFPHIRGLELPVHAVDKHDDPWRHLRYLPRDFAYILTPLPAVMQSLEKSPHFGLASTDAAGRQAALQLMERVQGLIARLEDHCGHAAVLAVQLHSAPSLLAAASEPCFQALRASLAELREKSWSKAELWLEHCDSFVADHRPAKGFLSLEHELPLLQEFAVGLNINWARSVLEGRQTATVLEHIQAAKKAGVLRCLFFSGVTLGDPVYGSWLDNHAPMQSETGEAWQAPASLLTAEEVGKAWRLAASPSLIRGLKVQPGPSSLTLSQRLDCLRQHVTDLQTLTEN